MNNINMGSPGSVDDITGRVGLTIEMFRQIDDPDLPVYWWIEDSMYGEDWAHVDGIDYHVDGTSADVWFENGRCKNVSVSTVIYMAAKHANPLLPEALSAAP